MSTYTPLSTYQTSDILKTQSSSTLKSTVRAAIYISEMKKLRISGIKQPAYMHAWGKGSVGHLCIFPSILLETLNCSKKIVFKEKGRKKRKRNKRKVLQLDPNRPRVS